MGFTTKQNTPVVLDLALQAKSTGWSFGNGYASHEVCNAGFMTVIFPDVEIIVGNSYTITYQVANRLSGFVQASIGSSAGMATITNGNFSETLVATGPDPKIRFYSNGVLDLKLFDIKSNTMSTASKQRNTIAFSEKTNKYTSFYPFTSDYGFSFFKDLFTFKSGRLYKHDQTIADRNRIYGVQYQTSVEIPFNVNKGQPKTFESISYEGNMLMVTTVDGITTSLGQVSELNSDDFLQETLNDGVNEVNIYDDEGIYSASFVRDKSIDINNGPDLKGTWIVIDLITTRTGLLRLSNVYVTSVPSSIGTR